MGGSGPFCARLCRRVALRVGLRVDGARHTGADRSAETAGVVGFYRHVRNPMYLGFTTGWIGLWVVFGHVNIAAILAVAAVALGVHLFVLFYEEPTLRGKFGAEYEEYCRNVRRWWPRLHAWKQKA